MGDEIILGEDKRAQLDGNIKNMLSGGATQEDVIKYASDFKDKFGQKKNISPNPIDQPTTTEASSTSTTVSEPQSTPLDESGESQPPITLSDESKQVTQPSDAIVKPIAVDDRHINDFSNDVRNTKKNLENKRDELSKAHTDISYVDNPQTAALNELFKQYGQADDAGKEQLKPQIQALQNAPFEGRTINIPNANPLIEDANGKQVPNPNYQENQQQVTPQTYKGEDAKIPEVKTVGDAYNLLVDKSDKISKLADETNAAQNEYVDARKKRLDKVDMNAKSGFFEGMELASTMNARMNQIASYAQSGADDKAIKELNDYIDDTQAIYQKANEDKTEISSKGQGFYNFYNGMIRPIVASVGLSAAGSVVGQPEVGTAYIAYDAGQQGFTNALAQKYTELMQQNPSDMKGNYAKAKEYATKEGLGSAAVMAGGMGLMSRVSGLSQLSNFAGETFSKGISDYGVEAGGKRGVETFFITPKTAVLAPLAYKQVLAHAIGEGAVFAGAEALKNQYMKGVAKDLGIEEPDATEGVANMALFPLLMNTAMFAFGKAGKAIMGNKNPYDGLSKESKGDVVMALATYSPDANEEMLTKGVSNGIITPEQKIQLTGEIETARKALDKMPDNATADEIRTNVPLLIKKDKLLEEKKRLDPAFHSKIDEQIAKIDEQLNPKQDAVQEQTTTESVLRNEGVQREGELPRVEQENKSENATADSETQTAQVNPVVEEHLPELQKVVTENHPIDEEQQNHLDNENNQHQLGLSDNSPEADTQREILNTVSTVVEDAKNIGERTDGKNTDQSQSEATDGQRIENAVKDNTDKSSETTSEPNGQGQPLADETSPQTEQITSVDTPTATDAVTPKVESTPQDMGKEQTFVTHNKEVVSGEKLTDAINKVADDMVESAKKKRQEPYASHVTEKQKDEILAKDLAYAESVRKGENLNNLTIAQKINYELTGESVPLLPKEPTGESLTSEADVKQEQPDGTATPKSEVATKEEAKPELTQSQKARQATKDFLKKFGSADLPEGTKKLGSGIDDVVDAVFDVYDASIKAGKAVKEAIEDAIKHFKESDFYKGLKEENKQEAEDFIRGQVENKEPRVSGISHRVLQKMGIDTEAAEGWTPEQAHEIGKGLLSEFRKDGIDPNKVLFDKEDKSISLPEKVALRKAVADELASVKNKAGDAKGLESKEYKDAKKAQSDFLENTKYLGGEAQKSMVAFQGETDVDTGSFTSLVNHYEETHGRTPNKQEQVKIKELAEENRKAKEGLENSVAQREKELEQAIKERDELDKRLKEQQERHLKEIAELKSKKEFEKVKQDVRKNKRQVTREELKKEREVIIENIKRKLQPKGVLSLPVDVIPDVVKLARNYVESGVNNLQELIDKIHEDLGGIAEKDDIRDAFSGFGKEQKEKASEDWRKNLSRLKKEAKNVSSDEKLNERFVDKDKKDLSFHPKDARDIFDYLKRNYLEKGIDYTDAIGKTATDLGLTPEQVQHAIASPKTAKKGVSDDIYMKQKVFREANNKAKRFVASASENPIWKAVKKTNDFLRGALLFGHGTAWGTTHTSGLLLNPTYWKQFFPKWWQAAKSTFAFTKEGQEKHEAMMQSVKLDPNWRIANEAGLDNDPNKQYGDYDKLSAKLPAIMNMGSRGFDLMLPLRQELFNKEWNKLSNAQKADPTMAKAIAHYFNRATGISDMKVSIKGKDSKLEDITDNINGIMLAPKLEFSRWQKLYAPTLGALNTFAKVVNNKMWNDKAGAWSETTAGERWGAKTAVKNAAINMATFGTALAINSAILQLLDSKKKVNYLHPLEGGDWLDFQIGDHHIGVTGGITSTGKFVLGLANLALTHSRKERGGETIKSKAFDVAGNYASGKLAPGSAMAFEIFKHHDFNGNTLPMFDDKPDNRRAKKLTWAEYFELNHTPIPVAEAFHDMHEEMKKQGMKEKDINIIMSGIFVGAAAGLTGARIKPDNEGVIKIPKIDLAKPQKIDKVKIPTYKFN